jgi:hypothetical protein
VAWCVGPRLHAAGSEAWLVHKNVIAAAAGAHLVPDVQQVREARRHDQRAALPLALQQRVGGHGGAHADGRDAAGVEGGAPGGARGRWWL